MQLALKISPTLPILHLVALVHFECRSFSLASNAVDAALARNARQPVALAVRSLIASSQDQISDATRDAESARVAANLPPSQHAKEDLDVQTSRTNKTTYSTVANLTPSTPLPILPEIAYLLPGVAWLNLSEPMKAASLLSNAIGLGPGGDPFAKAVTAFAQHASVMEGPAKTEALRGIEEAWKLAGEMGKEAATVDVDERLSDERPLRSVIGLYLAQAKTDQENQKSILQEVRNSSRRP